MGKTQTYKLLSKTTFIYLLFTFIAFFGSALFLTHETDEFIQRELEHRFHKFEHRLKHYIESGRPVDKFPAEMQVIRLKDSTVIARYPIISDTLIYNSELDEMQQFMKKETVIKANDQHYRFVLIKSMHDYLRLRDDIFGSLIPAFVLLALGIVLFNFFLSGYLFQPFNVILRRMKTYKVGHGQDIREIRTSTSEFKKMQGLFRQMIDRIDEDYCNLKEYTENMAHEIQTPLAIIRNKTENLIADPMVMKRQADAVKIIYEESNHLSKLGTTLNLITKIENREFEKAVVVHTKPVIEKHIEAIKELVQLKSLSIETNLDSAHQLFIDPYLLDIVLKNLMRNAVSYATTDGPIRIITTGNSLRVSNFAPPLDFSPEHIFQRFRRNHQTKSSLGLGLALVRKICALNKLQINYQYQRQQHIFTITDFE